MPYRAGDEIVRGYRLVQFLGKGGFGEVWKATAPGGAEVAIKIIQLSAKQGQKELRAVGLMKQVRHPNLVPIMANWLRDQAGNMLESSDSPDQQEKAHGSIRETLARNPNSPAELIIAMGLGEKSLGDRLEECVNASLPGIPLEELLDYMEDSARGLDFLNSPRHDLGHGLQAIQHHDVKPANIMIVGGAVQVCDFGLARAVDSSNDLRATSISGSPAYSSPEVLGGKTATSTSDQYSLAITYFELRTGKLPFRDTTFMEVLSSHLNGRLCLGDLNESERSVIARATSLDPSKRFETCVKMVRSLRRAAEGLQEKNPSEGQDAGAPVAAPVQLRPGRELIPGFRLVERFQFQGNDELWEAVVGNGNRVSLLIRKIEGQFGSLDLPALNSGLRLEHPNLQKLMSYRLLDKDWRVLNPESVFGQPPTWLVLVGPRQSRSILARLEEHRTAGLNGIPLAELLNYMAELASALDYLNQSVPTAQRSTPALAHCNVLPINIFLDEGRAQLGNFSLLHVLQGEEASLGSDLFDGLHSFLAPELADRKLGRRSDQYSLAITYFQLRTGSLPFNMARSTTDLMRSIRIGHTDLGALPAAEAEVVARATSLAAQDRFPTCQDFVTALKAAGLGQAGLGQAGLGQAGLGQVGLSNVGLGQAGLGPLASASRIVIPSAPPPSARLVSGESDKIAVRCPKCETVFRLDRTAVGRQGKCDKCGTKFPITADQENSGATGGGAAHSSTEKSPALQPAGQQPADLGTDSKRSNAQGTATLAPAGAGIVPDQIAATQLITKISTVHMIPPAVNPPGSPEPQSPLTTTLPWDELPKPSAAQVRGTMVAFPEPAPPGVGPAVGGATLQGKPVGTEAGTSGGYGRVLMLVVLVAALVGIGGTLAFWQPAKAWLTSLGAGTKPPDADVDPIVPPVVPKIPPVVDPIVPPVAPKIPPVVDPIVTPVVPKIPPEQKDPTSKLDQSDPVFREIEKRMALAATNAELNDWRQTRSNLDTIDELIKKNPDREGPKQQALRLVLRAISEDRAPIKDVPDTEKILSWLQQLRAPIDLTPQLDAHWTEQARLLESKALTGEIAAIEKLAVDVPENALRRTAVVLRAFNKELSENDRRLLVWGQTRAQARLAKWDQVKTSLAALDPGNTPQDKARFLILTALVAHHTGQGPAQIDLALDALRELRSPKDLTEWLDPWEKQQSRDMTAPLLKSAVRAADARIAASPKDAEAAYARLLDGHGDNLSIEDSIHVRLNRARCVARQGQDWIRIQRDIQEIDKLLETNRGNLAAAERVLHDTLAVLAVRHQPPSGGVDHLQQLALMAAIRKSPDIGSLDPQTEQKWLNDAWQFTIAETVKTAQRQPPKSRQTLLDGVLQYDPQNVQARHSKATTLFELKEYATARKALQELSGQASDPDGKREVGEMLALATLRDPAVDARAREQLKTQLPALLRDARSKRSVELGKALLEVADSPAYVRDVALPALEEALARVDAPGKDELKKLRSTLLLDSYGALRNRIRQPADSIDFARLLIDCRRGRQDQVADAWILAAYLESILESTETAVTREDPTPATLEAEITAALKSLPSIEAELAAYVSYVRGLAHLRAMQSGPADAAFEQAFRGTTIPIVLRGFRSHRAAARLVSKSLPLLTISGKPLEALLGKWFASAETAKQAYTQATLALRLFGDNLPPDAQRLEVILPLAAWSQSPPDRQAAASLAAKALTSSSEQKLGSALLPLLLIEAETQPQTVTGQQRTIANLHKIWGALEPLATGGDADARDQAYRLSIERAIKVAKQMPQTESDPTTKQHLAKLHAAKGRLIWKHQLLDKEVPQTRNQEGFNAFDRAIQVNGQVAEYYAGRAYFRALLPTLELDALRDDVAKAVKLDPQFADAYGAVGSAYLLDSRRQTNSAERASRLVEAIDAFTQVMELPKTRKLPDELAMLLVQRSSASMELANFCGNKDRSRKSLEDAERDAREAIKISPKHQFNGQLALGNAIEDFGLILNDNQYEAACQAFLDATKINAQDPVAWMSLGRAMYRRVVLGREDVSYLQRGLEAVDKSLALGPELAEPYYWKGLLLQARNDFVAADKAFEKAVELEEKFKGPYLQTFAMAWIELLKNIAFQEYQVDPSSTTTKAKLARFREQAKRLGKADRALMIGQTHEWEGDFDQAYRLYDEALQTTKEHVELLIRRATIRLLDPAMRRAELARDDLLSVKDADLAAQLAKAADRKDQQAQALFIASQARILKADATAKAKSTAPVPSAKVVADLTSAVALAPTNPEAWYWNQLLANELNLFAKMSVYTVDQRQEWKQGAIRALEAAAERAPGVKKAQLRDMLKQVKDYNIR